MPRADLRDSTLPQVAPDSLPPPTRRFALIALASAAVMTPIAALAGSGAAPIAGAVQQPHPDAELLRAIAEFDELGRRFVALYDNNDDVDEEQLEPQAAPIVERQREVMVTLCAQRATQPETILARARLAAFYHATPRDEPDPEGYFNEELINVLMRDLREYFA